LQFNFPIKHNGYDSGGDENVEEYEYGFRARRGPLPDTDNA
jgi:hypothetical protein